MLVVPRVWKGYSLALAGAVGFSGKAIVAKLLYRHGIDATAAVALRMLLAWPFFIAMTWWGGRGKPALTRAEHGRILVLGFSGYYLASVLDFSGLQYISASLERLILYVYPTVVLVIVSLRSRRPVSRPQALALAVSYAGVLFAFGDEAAASVQRGAGHIVWGSMLVLCSAISYGIYLVLSAETVGRFGSVRLTGLASGVACVLCVGQFCLLRPWHAWAEFSPAVWELSIINATVCTVLPMWMVMRAMELIGASHSAQVSMIGPLATVLLAVWLLQEPLTGPLLIGTVLVLLGIGMLSRHKVPAPAPEAPPKTKAALQP